MTILKDEPKKEEKPEEEEKLTIVIPLDKDVKELYESEPHKTNVLPKEFEPYWKKASAKWAQLQENEET